MALKEAIRSGIGILGIGLVVAGIWGNWGWQWALIAAGLPVAVFYLYSEASAVGLIRGKGE